jgi:two-component system cell cycle response regulator CpdR
MRILLAEDDRIVRELVVEMLQDAGHEVAAAGNGAEALRMLLESGTAGFDLLLTDIAMPVMNGFELARQAVALWPDLPILYVSGDASKALAEDLPIVPAALLDKPFRLKVLLATAERCVAGASALAGAEDAPSRECGGYTAAGQV